jgi:succinate dehydrogenase / fumarate reductase membrane anchor subunit
MSGRAINWYLQRITGAALLVLLILHFWVEHFTAEVRTHGLTFEVIQRRFFANHWFVAVDITFLIVATYHGLNGVRNIILDFGRVTRAYRIGVTVVLIALGITLAVWGIGAFRGNPHFNPMNPKNVADTRPTATPETTSVTWPSRPCSRSDETNDLATQYSSNSLPKITIMAGTAMSRVSSSLSSSTGGPVASAASVAGR